MRGVNEFLDWEQSCAGCIEILWLYIVRALSLGDIVSKLKIISNLKKYSATKLSWLHSFDLGGILQIQWKSQEFPQHMFLGSLVRFLSSIHGIKRFAYVPTTSRWVLPFLLILLVMYTALLARSQFVSEQWMRMSQWVNIWLHCLKSQPRWRGFGSTYRFPALSFLKFYFQRFDDELIWPHSAQCSILRAHVCNYRFC